jgi:hypothetical protein
MRRGNIFFIFDVVLSIPHLFPKLVYMTAKDDFFVQRPYLFLSLSSLCAACLFKLTGDRGYRKLKRQQNKTGPLKTYSLLNRENNKESGLWRSQALVSNLVWGDEAFLPC